MNKSVEHIQTLEGTHTLKKVFQITDNCAPHYKSVNHFYQQVSFVINPAFQTTFTVWNCQTNRTVAIIILQSIFHSMCTIVALFRPK